MTDLLKQVTLNQFLATSILVIFVSFNLRAVPRLISEVQFYHNHNWNFSKDSGKSVLMQNGLVQKFSFLPIGLLKLVVLGIQICMILMPFVAAYNGYVARHNS